MIAALDLAMIGLLIFSGVIAFARGFLQEILSVSAFVIAALATLFVMDVLLEPAEQALSPLVPTGYAQLLVIAVVFLLVYIVVSIATASIADFVRSEDGVGFIDRTAGLVFGVARGLVVAALLLIVYASAGGGPQWTGRITAAQTYPLVRSTAQATLDLVERLTGESSLTQTPLPEAT